MVTDELVYTETRVWKLDHVWGGVGSKETAIWAKAIGRGHLCTLDTRLVFFFFFFFYLFCQILHGGVMPFF